MGIHSMTIMLRTVIAFLLGTTVYAKMTAQQAVTESPPAESRSAEVPADGAPAAPAKLTPQIKENLCGRKALQLKNCLLRSRPYAIQFWPDKVSVHDGVNRSLTTLPFAGEKVEWELARVTKLDKTTFIEWVAWEAPSEKSDIQTKSWYVYRLNHEKTELVLTKPLVKRKRVEDSKPRSDAEFQFGLRTEKGKAVWFYGKEKGFIK